MIPVTFACGHAVLLKGDENPPTCHCGETRVMISHARAPSFRGVVQGPHAQFEALPAIAVTLKGD